MEVNDELIQRVIESEKTKNAWRSKFDSVEFKEANLLNQRLFGEKLKPLEGCECLPTFFFNLKVLLNKNKIFETMEKEFRIKKDKVIMNNNFATALTSASSDEDCIKLLRLNEKFISSFDKFPSNWKEIISGKKTEAKVETKTEEVSEVMAEVVAETTPAKKQYKKRK